MERMQRAPLVKNFIAANTNGYKKSYENEECVICMNDFSEEDGKEIAELSCKHIYHVECLKEWVDKNDTCPTCRAPIVQ